MAGASVSKPYGFLCVFEVNLVGYDGTFDVLGTVFYEIIFEQKNVPLRHDSC